MLFFLLAYVCARNAVAVDERNLGTSGKNFKPFLSSGGIFLCVNALMP